MTRQRQIDAKSGYQSSARCDAAHDHCLRDCTWLLAEPTGQAGDVFARAFHVDAAGVFVERDDSTNTAEPGFVAYRTVPVTRQNLRVGALVLSVTPRRWDEGLPVVTMLDRPIRTIWDVGTVASIDWAGGVLMLEGRPRPYLLSATRLAVLRYEDGGEVELIPGVDARAPAAGDVIAPPPPMP